MTYQPKVKICGVRDGDTAFVVADAGADFFGVVLVEGVRRQLSPFHAQEVVRDYRIRSRDHRVKRLRQKVTQVVGLFRNQDARWVNTTARQVDVDYVQLNGEEDEAYMRAMWKPIIRQVRIKSDVTRDELSDLVDHHLSHDRIVLLDRYDEQQPGGTGKTFDWSIAEEIASREGVLLAGGLDTKNVQSAVNRLNPWGVDVSTGVETEGIKDHHKIRSFIETAKSF